MTKYRNIPTIIDGLRFDSKAEAARWSQLCLMERAGLIRELRRQVRMPLVVNDLLVCTYVADFVYIAEAGEQVIEDVKGHRTREFILKKKLAAALGVTITELSAGRVRPNTVARRQADKLAAPLLRAAARRRTA